MFTYAVGQKVSKYERSLQEENWVLGHISEIMLIPCLFLLQRFGVIEVTKLTKVTKLGL